MSTSSDIRSPLGPFPSIEPLRAHSGWIIALGVVYTIAGIVALGSIVTATVVTVFVVGIMMVIAGIAEVIDAFQFKSWGKVFLWLVLGALYIVSGLLAISNPVLAAVILTLVLGATLIVSGLMRFVLAFSMREVSHWVWPALSGVITFLVGCLILSRWPFSSLYVLGIFLGVDLLVAGIGWIILGSGLRSRTA